MTQKKRDPKAPLYVFRHFKKLVWGFFLPTLGRPVWGYFARTLTDVRRFWARPSSVPLSATGNWSP